MAENCDYCGAKKSFADTFYDFPFGELSPRVCADCYKHFVAVVDNRSVTSLAHLKSVADSNPTSAASEIYNALLLVPTVQERFEEEIRTQEAFNQLTLTSGFNLEGSVICEYVDFISSEVVLGMGLFRSIGASITNIVGDESGGLTIKLQDARRIAKERLKKQAFDLGCNAVIGVDINITMFGDTLVGIICNGTAVKAEKLA